MSNAWKCLPVREFIRQCNWEQTALAKSAQSVVKRQSLTHWQCLTAQDFFDLHNWSGQAALVDGFELATASVNFSLTLGSGQFWQCFNWLGEKKAPPAEKIEQIIEHTEETIAEVQEFSLNDLSQLF